MSSNASPSAALPLGFGLRLNLSVMMFLQFAIWGAWFTVLGNYLGQIGFSKGWIGSIYGTMALGTIFAPLIVGQIADRFFPSQWLMAILHLAGAGILYWMAQISPAHLAGAGSVTPEVTETAARGFYLAALIYALVYSPTLALSNSIAFTHIPDGQRDFPGIRVFGTIGWIAAGMIVGKILPQFAEPLAKAFNVPLDLARDPKLTNLPILLAAAFSAILGILSLALPHTPPKGQAGDAIPFLKAVSLLKTPSFAVFFGVSFVITIVLAFYYGFTGIWLEKEMGVKDVASTMTIGQWSEMLLLPFLPLFLRWMGMKGVLVFGMLAWGTRYAWFAFTHPNPSTLPFTLPFDLGNQIDWSVVLPLALHGICYDFFFAAAFIHVDNESPADIRGSAQALFTFLTYGLGMWLGNMISGQLADWLTKKNNGVMDWQTFWLIPSVGVLASMLVFVVFFRLEPKAK
ncbi:MAG: MFS transporter [Gemmataceae bacterium]|nr:MFS transporter [Gemmataceae bacterium]